MAFRFIHAADIHLDSPLLSLDEYPGAPLEEIRLATRRALARLVDVAIENGAAFVVIAGDRSVSGPTSSIRARAFAAAISRKISLALSPKGAPGHSISACSILRQPARPNTRCMRRAP